MSLLQKAVEIAVRAHRDQKRRNGDPYVLHPLRMMCRMRTDTERILAVLHDVVEDTDYTFEQLKAEGFPEEVIQALDCLTKQDGEPYDAFVERTSRNRLATTVKLADLEDNMDVLQSGKLTPADLERFEKYRRAWKFLTSREPPLS